MNVLLHCRFYVLISAGTDFQDIRIAVVTTIREENRIELIVYQFL